ncbi:MAG: hypothetical protein KKB21_05050 [Nanoarchaeota archaeon]|nr:hypothetical protein [Nanoarchaeota archaeon]MBU4086914.1 hypothetical protein [Nanoarchaeota archaeon]
MINSIKRGLAGLVLSVGMAVSGASLPGCISVREGDNQLSAIVSPFGARVAEERYESGTNNPIGKKVMDITAAFGNIHREVKFYSSDGKYIGGYKVRYDGILGGNPRVSTEVYDSGGRTVRVIDGEEDVDVNIKN